MNATYYSIKHFRRLMKERRIYLWPAVLTGLIASLIGLLVPWFSKYFVDEILINQSTTYYIPFLTIWLLFDLIRYGGFSLRSLYSANCGESTTVGVSVFILKKIHRCSEFIRRKYRIGDFIARIEEVESNGGFIIDIVNEFTEMVVYVVTLPFLFLFINYRLALIVGSTVAFSVIVSLVSSRLIKRIHVKDRVEQSTFENQIISSIEKMPSIQLYMLGDTIFNQIDDRNYRIKDIRVKKVLVSQASRLLNKTAFALGMFFYRVYSVKLVYDGRMSIGDFFAFNVVLSLLFSPIEMLAALVKPIQEMFVNNRRLLELLLQPEQSSGSRQVVKSELSVEGVKFAYEDDGPLILKGVNLTLKPGFHYGLIGANGSGKSTICKIISRIEDPEDGEVRVGNVNVEEFDLRQYRSIVSYVHSEPLILASSLKHNIVLNAPYDKDKYDQIIRDLELQGIKEKLPTEQMPPFVACNIGLSSGEKQKIEIARAIYHDRFIYIFDEALSFIDSNSLMNMIEQIRNYLKDRIVLFVSHSAKIIEKTDKLLYLKDGRILIEGSTKELLGENEVIKHLFLQ